MPLILIAMLILVTAASAQHPVEGKSACHDAFFLDPHLREAAMPMHPPALVSTAFPHKELQERIDVISYDIRLDWYHALTTPSVLRGQRKATGHVHARIRSMVNGLDTLVLDAVALTVDSVFVDGMRVPFSGSVTLLRIPLSTAVDADDTIDVDIHYAIRTSDRAFYAYSQEDANQLSLPHPIAFTFNEPEDARRWLPCHDVPSDKALFTVNVRVPAALTVVSNGTPRPTVADGDTASWQSWHHPLPMPTYLFAVNASDYVLYEQVYRRTSGGEVPIYNYHWGMDDSGLFFNARNALRNIPRMFEAFEDKYGEYPFPTYGHVTVAPIQFGGMEHQSMSTINRRWLMGDVETGYAHELAHQWFGDMVTCETWGDIWLNEGGASFSEAVWLGFSEGAEGYRRLLADRRNVYMKNGLAEPPVYDIPMATLFNEATTYCKSGWVYHMMRRMTGDDAFFPAIRTYLQRHRLSSAQTADMLETLQQEIPAPTVPWDTFFDQWLVKAGHPVFVADAVQSWMDGGHYVTTVTVAQTQQADNVPNPFIVPLTIRLHGQGQSKDTTVLMSASNLQVDIASTFVLDSIQLDPDDDLLCEKTVNTVSSVDRDDVVANAVLRLTGSHPVEHGMSAQFVVETAAATLQIVDAMGRQVFANDVVSGIVMVPTSAMTPGLYVARLVSSTSGPVSTVTFIVR